MPAGNKWVMLMRLKLVLTVVSRAAFWMALAVTLPPAFAQTGVRGIFVTPIPNNPLMAVVEVERHQIFPNGNVQNLKTMHAIARDSQGRIYSEMRPLIPASSNDTPPILSILIYDPQTRVSTFISPQQRLARQNVVNRPPATLPLDLDATPAGNNLPVNPLVKEEDLGTRTMDGVPAHGVRKTQTIPAANSSTGKEVVVIDEYWYSDDLRLNLLVKHSDPRSLEVTSTVSQVTRTDPDPGIFAIPSGYKIAGSAAATPRP